MQDKNTKYDSMAMTHFKLPIKKKKDLKGENEISQLMNKYLLLLNIQQVLLLFNLDNNLTIL